MTALFNIFPPVVKKAVQVLVNLISMACYGFIIPDSIRFVIYQHSIRSTGLDMPMSLVLAAVPVGCIGLVIRLLIDTVGVVKGTCVWDATTSHYDKEVMVK
jgi:TRAP-type C4-dicarboxylate transport system permease small subunit